MKSLLILLASLCVAVVMFLGGIAVAAYVVSDPEPHRFANVDSPDLWTASPVHVDPSGQDYERIEAASMVASLPASGDGMRMVLSPAAGEDDAVNAATEQVAMHPAPATDLEDEGQPEPPALDPQHADWCFGRYRSYRLEDDSYQPYGGGPRQQCQSPWSPMNAGLYEAAGGMQEEMSSEPEARVQPVMMAGADRQSEHAAAVHQDAGVAAHEQWCLSRYRSYRMEDNSYQPMDGGARRACSSPHG